VAARLVRANSVEVARCGEKLDHDLADPIAGHLLQRFYAESGNYAGHSFLGLPLVTGDHLTEADLLAVTTLEVRFRPRALRLLIEGSKWHDDVLPKLRTISEDLCIAGADDEELDKAYVLVHTVDDLVGQHQWVAVQKLCARKRPSSFRSLTA
jgi:hypothetical protein